MDEPANQWLHWQFAAVVLAVYVLSLFLPAVSIPVRQGPTEVNGKVVDPGGKMLPPLRLSGAGAFEAAMDKGLAANASTAVRIAGVAWFANPILWIGCVLLILRRNLLSMLAGLIALGLMLLPYLFPDPGPENSTYLAGYWTWLTSAVLLAAFGLAVPVYRGSDSTAKSKQIA